MSKSNYQSEIKEKINEIEEKSANGEYIYRGEPERHEEPPHFGKVSSSLWRQFPVEVELFDVEAVQKEMLNDAKKHIGQLPYDSRVDFAASWDPTEEYAKGPIDFEILTEIQHYGGGTNLIDFTTDYLIALFFACDGAHDKDGRVILQEIEEIRHMVKRPRNPRHRVIAQKSVFVRPPKGFIEPHEADLVEIPARLKPDLLEFLQQYHGISTETIYNDLHGFIRNQDIHGGAYTEFYRGFVGQKRGDEAVDSKEKQREYEEAIEHYTIAIQLRPYFPVAFNNRGNAHRRIGIYDRAFTDYNKAIELKPDYAEPYNNRGNAHIDKDEHERAIEDYSTAIKLNPKLAKPYSNRGVAYFHTGETELAIEDYNKAIELDPDDGDTYYNRAEVWLSQSKWGKAREDLRIARNKGTDIIAAFQHDYKNPKDFEDRYDVTMPIDIAGMLTNKPSRSAITAKNLPVE